MKKTGLLLFTILTLVLTSCREDTTQLAKQEFSKYYNGKDEVALNIEGNIYFENRILDKDIFEPSCYVGTMIFYEDLIYYISINSINKKYRNEYINIYSCDYYGENINTIYSKEINTNNNEITVKTSNDSFYFEYKKDGLIYVDKYTIPTKIYESIACNKNCDIFDYFQEEQSKYDVQVIKNASTHIHGKFIVTDSETGISNTIDDDYLKGTIYFSSMEIYNYGPKRVDISNGHILLTYGIGAGDGWNYPHLVFEYDFTSNSLEYKLLAFPFDNVPVDIIYID